MESPQSPSKRKSASGSLFLRVLSAVVFLPPFFLLTRNGSLPFALLVGAIALLATGEIYAIIRAHRAGPSLVLLLVASAAVTALLYEGRTGTTLLVFVALPMIVLLAALTRKGSSPFTTAAGSLFAVFYATVLPGFLILLRELPRHTGSSAADYGTGGSYVFLLFLMVWGSDTGAYFTGRAFGRRKLAPSISPGKTVEGAIGGLLSSVGGAFLAGHLLFPDLNVLNTIILGVVTGLLAQAGDLVESLMKREVEIKDSARWIPGHGGVLDRFDGIFFTAPFLYYYLLYAPFAWPGGTP